MSWRRDRDSAACPACRSADPCSHRTFQLHGSKLAKCWFCCLDFTNALSHLFPITRYPHSSHTHKNSTNCSSFQQLTLPRSRILSTMSTADELKALGNKAIAEKNFDEAVLVTSTVVSFVLLLSDTNRSHPAEQSSPRPLPWHPKTTSSTATGPPPTPQRKTTQTP